jgi:lipid-A-disaccharide synthase
MQAADFLIVASGTVTLEAGLLGVPMVIIYRLSWFSASLGRLLMRVKYLGLINLVLGREVVPEFLQGQATPARIAQAVGQLLKDPEKRSVMSRDLLSVRSRLGEEGASRRAARHIVQFLDALSPS